MIKKIIKKVILAIVLLGLIFLSVEHIIYYSVIWYLGDSRINNISEDSFDPLGLMDFIELISNRSLIPAMTRTIKAQDANCFQVKAATIGLVKADRIISEKIFVDLLKSGDSLKVGIAISGLTDLNAKQYYNEVANLANSPHAIVRLYVADYLGLFKTESAKSILMHLKEDKNPKVVYYAKKSLKKCNLN